MDYIQWKRFLGILADLFKIKNKTVFTAFARYFVETRLAAIRAESLSTPFLGRFLPLWLPMMLLCRLGVVEEICWVASMQFSTDSSWTSWLGLFCVCTACPSRAHEIHAWVQMEADLSSVSVEEEKCTFPSYRDGITTNLPPALIKHCASLVYVHQHQTHLSRKTAVSKWCLHFCSDVPT